MGAVIEGHRAGSRSDIQIGKSCGSTQYDTASNGDIARQREVDVSTIAIDRKRAATTDAAGGVIDGQCDGVGIIDGRGDGNAAGVGRFKIHIPSTDIDGSRANRNGAGDAGIDGKIISSNGKRTGVGNGDVVGVANIQAVGGGGNIGAADCDVGAASREVQSAVVTGDSQGSAGAWS